MLTHLQIRDFAIIDSVELELRPGLTVLTGETGAGKSILVDALQLIAGGRARLGQTLYVPMSDGDLEVEVTAPVFYDPKGARINA